MRKFFLENGVEKFHGKIDIYNRFKFLPWKNVPWQKFPDFFLILSFLHKQVRLISIVLFFHKIIMKKKKKMKNFLSEKSKKKSFTLNKLSSFSFSLVRAKPYRFASTDWNSSGPNQTSSLVSTSNHQLYIRLIGIRRQ